MVHRDPRVFTDPERFWPDRWQDDLHKRLPRGAYFPFGTGPHICLGNHFAMLEGILILALLARMFRWTPEDGTQRVVPEPAITLRPQHGLRLRLCRCSHPANL